MEVTGQIMALPDEAPDDAEAEPTGQMQMLLVRVAEARDDEVSLLAVFDSYDKTLHQTYRALFNKSEEIRSSLGMDPFVHEVLFVRSLELKPCWQGTSLAVQAIQSFATHRRNCHGS
jgi:hypothetical protein